MSNLATKRILSDLKIIKTSQLDKHNIFVSTDDKDIYNIKSLIIGPDDTPYEGGFYFLDITFPKNYPMEPPKAKFMTLNSQVRFNPNLYKNGKVCVSLLNTWSGPGWTTCCTLSAVLLSIQSLLNEKPIQNEPGWEKEEGEKCKTYNELIEFFNLKVGVLQMINETPHGFEEFKDIMIKYYVNNFDKYRKFIEKRIIKDGEIKNLRLYNMSAKLEYTKVYEQMLLLYSGFEELYK
jgi:ubiquitin-conjugating enzyme E2 Z